MLLLSAIPQFATFLRTERNLAPRTIAAYTYDLERFATWAQAQLNRDVRVDQVETWLLKEYLATMVEDHHLKPTSQSRIVSTLRVFFRWLVEDGRIESNPAKSLRTPKKGRKLPLYLTPGEARALAAAPSEEDDPALQLRDETILILLLLTGMRLSEIVGLDVGDWDLEGGTLKVLGKGRKERLIPLNPAAAAALDRWVRGRWRPMDDCRALFLARDGSRISPRSIQHAVKKAVKRRGLDPRISPHKLRHTFATTLYAEATELRDIQDLLGHANIASTSVYTHTNVDRIREAVRTLRLTDKSS